MPKARKSLQESLTAYRKASDRESVKAAEKQREEILKRFPLEDWPTIPLERYAVGQEDSENTFCRWLEFRSPNAGSIKGGSARKLIIYKHRNKPGWYFDPRYKNEMAAWEAVRTGFVEAFEKAKEGEWGSIGELEALHSGPALLLKALYIYFPDEILPVNSQAHLRHFLRRLGRPEAPDRSLNVVQLNRMLRQALSEVPELQDWTTKEIERFLYFWDDPRETKTILKIAPGQGAKYWKECLNGGYICLGWEKLGDLREYSSKEELRERYEQTYCNEHPIGPRFLKTIVNRLWSLTELEPGDLIVANHGHSRVLAIGEVVEPGYEWRPDRENMNQTVRVSWDTSFAKEISPQKGWTSTIVPVKPKLYEVIVSDKREAAPAVPVESVFEEIAEALERKGQVILYGPPGTGKTYTAIRFAKWWLGQEEGKAADTLLHGQRVWWIVANPKNWVWDNLFRDGSVYYKYGRLQRNFAQVQSGDLVIGYQATPDKRIVALARVSKGLGSHKGEGKSIELKPVSKVENGLSYEELAADPALTPTEPFQFRNQGTLFAVSKDEAENILAELKERNPGLPFDEVEAHRVATLRMLTFHPSYSY